MEKQDKNRNAFRIELYGLILDNIYDWYDARNDCTRAEVEIEKVVDDLLKRWDIKPK